MSFDTQQSSLDTIKVQLDTTSHSSEYPTRIERNKEKIISDSNKDRGTLMAEIGGFDIKSIREEIYELIGIDQDRDSFQRQAADFILAPENLLFLIPGLGAGTLLVRAALLVPKVTKAIVAGTGLSASALLTGCGKFEDHSRIDYGSATPNINYDNPETNKDIETIKNKLIKYRSINEKAINVVKIEDHPYGNKALKVLESLMGINYTSETEGKESIYIVHVNDMNAFPEHTGAYADTFRKEGKHIGYIVLKNKKHYDSSNIDTRYFDIITHELMHAIGNGISDKKTLLNNSMTDEINSMGVEIFSKLLSPIYIFKSQDRIKGELINPDLNNIIGVYTDPEYDKLWNHNSATWFFIENCYEKYLENGKHFSVDDLSFISRSLIGYDNNRQIQHKYGYESLEHLNELLSAIWQDKKFQSIAYKIYESSHTQNTTNNPIPEIINYHKNKLYSIQTTHIHTEREEFYVKKYTKKFKNIQERYGIVENISFENISGLNYKLLDNMENFINLFDNIINYYNLGPEGTKYIIKKGLGPAEGSNLGYMIKYALTEGLQDFDFSKKFHYYMEPNDIDITKDLIKEGFENGYIY